MMILINIARLLIIPVVLFATACTTVDPELASPIDPWESFNRSMFSVNETLDTYIVLPLAQGYRRAVPTFFQNRVGSVFLTLGAVMNTPNLILQGRITHAASESSRFFLNATLGIFGMFDVASSVGIYPYNSSLGDTLGHFGIPAGPYVVLPVVQLGGSLRDAVGDPIQSYAKASIYENYAGINSLSGLGLTALEMVQARSQAIEAGKTVDDLMFDKYSLWRSIRYKGGK